ncbi:GTPase HflX [Heliobacterium gestii]|uniref:GTPase HflX n=1 Tax=Heliomicrobium gestii TaxID=2699 RepID=A0A845LK89_HELGE|nr:GTPase HflX [Heliomicrobium gestii]MBM7867258.1 GTP-binding protein HflX [Heliomicrobium gestii]MZP43813.1 GTPase HflX [Heliomicrobium gestii]
MSDQRIKGNLDGVARSRLDRLSGLLELQMDADLLLDPEVGKELVLFTSLTGREVALFVDRRGRVVDLAVGDAHTVAMSDHDGRRGTQRLAGVRCVHTHPGDSPHLSDVDLSALRQLRLDCMAVIAAAEPHRGSVACLSPGGEVAIEMTGPLKYEKLCAFPWREAVRLYEKSASTVETVVTGAEKERAFLIGLEGNAFDEEPPLEELAQLAETAGAVVVGRMTQRLERPDRSTYLGSGKIRELSLAVQVTRADLLIADEELSPAQQRRLESLTGARVVDRTALILDIFASRARTREGKLQVELAQLQYLLPRLTGQGQALSRLGGGIGTRGPGETKLETDRRHLRRRMTELEGELNHVRHHRERLRHSRQRSDLPLISMVGYTNAGKSTLSSLLVSRLAPLGGPSPGGEDKLFATLDPTTRRIRLPGERDVLISDTVGFIRKLPHSLVRAFRATLEEIVAADLLLHVVDASHPAAVEQLKTVEAVLTEIGAGEKPVLTVLNKIDRVTANDMDGSLLPIGPWVALSAHTGEGVDTLLATIAQMLPSDRVTIDALIPYNQGNQIDSFYRSGVVRQVTYEAEGVRIRADVPKAFARLFRGGNAIKGDNGNGETP